MYGFSFTGATRVNLFLGCHPIRKKGNWELGEGGSIFFEKSENESIGWFFHEVLLGTQT